MMKHAHDPTRTRRIEMILREIDTLPTPSPIALRLLSVASDEDADVGEVIALIQSDPGVTARLLGLCRRSTTGLGSTVTTVERAVLMLGLEAVRAMLLGVELREFIAGPARETHEPRSLDGADRAECIDRVGLWRHSLAVACAAERIVQVHSDRFEGLKADEAFVCGLLHDVGKIALDVLLPRSLAKAVVLAERRCEPLTGIEKTLIGIDHPTAGKRLAERWGLPELIRDAIWLHGRPAKSLPDLPHKRMVGVVTAANELARLMHVGESGNGAPPSPIARLAAEWSLDADKLEQIAVSLHERVCERSERLGIEQTPTTELLVASLGAANRTLVGLNEAHRKRTDRLRLVESVLAALRQFWDEAADAADPIDSLRAVAACGRSIFGAAPVVLAARGGVGPDPADETIWTAALIDDHGRIRRTVAVEQAPPASGGTGESKPGDPAAASLHAAIFEALGLDERESSQFKPMTLASNDAGAAMILHTWRPDRERGVALAAWRAACAGAVQRARSESLAEGLAELNADLVAARERATEVESYARLGELTAGAAHEMNNPLAVISGRAQLLRDAIEQEAAAGADTHAKRAAVEQIIESAKSLADLVAGLHFIVSPPTPSVGPVDMTDFISRTVKRVRQARTSQGELASPITVRIRGPVPPVHVDEPMFSVAVEELLRNALEAPESTHVELRVQTDDSDDRLMISVLDDGRGIPPEALAHATDPFFSRRDAGRGTGFGLAKTRRIVELHGGRLSLKRRPEGGTEARLTLERWRAEHITRDDPAGDSPVQQAA